LVRFIRPLKHLHVRRMVIAYMGLSLALGPILISNIILKDNMGRARPKQTVEFGGHKQFTPALLPSKECPRNCSFVSGHASTGFFLVTFAFLMAPGLRRRAAFAGALAIGTAAGLGRIAEGGHYLSDVVFAGLINFGIAWGLYHLMIGRQKSGAGSLIPVSWKSKFIAWRQAVFGNHGAAQFNSSPGTHWLVHAAVFTAIVSIAVLSYLFLDRAFTDMFLKKSRQIYHIMRTLALAGDSFYWLIAFASGFAVTYLTARLPRFSEAKDRLLAWSWLALFLFTSVAATGIAAKILKIVLARARPVHYIHFDEYGFHWFEMNASFQSFPSGHAVTIVAVMTALYFIVPRLAPLFILIGAVVALARAAALYHFLSDVFVGAYLAIIMTAWIRMVFVRSGIGLTLATLGHHGPTEKPPWPVRLGIRA
jgi:membrane-associated phospholipid phosphatase